MDEYIDREAFLAAKREQYCKDCERRKGIKNGKVKILYEIGDAPCRACGINDVLDDVEDFPAADVAPVRHGRWKPGDMPTYGGYKCSVCGGNTVLYKATYCPHCGALMDKDGDGDV